MVRVRVRARVRARGRDMGCNDAICGLIGPPIIIENSNPKSDANVPIPRGAMNRIRIPFCAYPKGRDEPHPYTLLRPFFDPFPRAACLSLIISLILTLILKAFPFVGKQLSDIQRNANVFGGLVTSAAKAAKTAIEMNQK